MTRNLAWPSSVPIADGCGDRLDNQRNLCIDQTIFFIVVFIKASFYANSLGKDELNKAMPESVSRLNTKRRNATSEMR